jgi:hypothetical protein
LIGGDTDSTPGPVTIAVMALGEPRLGRLQRTRTEKANKEQKTESDHDKVGGSSTANPARFNRTCLRAGGFSFQMKLIVPLARVFM